LVTDLNRDSGNSKIHKLEVRRYSCQKTRRRAENFSTQILEQKATTAGCDDLSCKPFGEVDFFDG
jgi:hypothetical protein